jgi:hypothetical protein
MIGHADNRTAIRLALFQEEQNSEPRLFHLFKLIFLWLA